MQFGDSKHREMRLMSIEERRAATKKRRDDYKTALANRVAELKAKRANPKKPVMPANKKSAALLGVEIPTKFFRFPFGEAGDLMTIPDTIQVDGSVSYEEGFGIDYQLDPATNPNSLPVPRDQFNELMFDITTVLQEYQAWGIPNFITTAQNGGVAYSYSKDAYALYDDGDGLRVFQSLVDTNTSLPTDTTKWRWADNSAQALILTKGITFEGTVIDGDAVYWNSGTGEFTKAVADGSAAQNMVGIADVTHNRVYASGDLISILSGLTPGSVYFLSPDTAGGLTTTQPGANVVRTGVAKSATELFLRITPEMIGGLPPGSIVDYVGFGIPAGGFLAGDGSAIARTGLYAQLFAATTSIQNGVLTNGNINVTGLTDTSQFKIGMAIEGTGIAASTTVASIVNSTAITLSIAATANGTQSLSFFMNGNGNGTTTFNILDSRRRVGAGAGGGATAVLGNVPGAIGGEEAHIQLLGELAAHTHTGTVEIHAEGSGSFIGNGDPDVFGTQPVTLNSTGSSDPMNIMQPTYICTKLVKY